MVPARQQNVAIKAHAAGHAGGLDKAGNAECGVLLPCPKGCPAQAASAALQILGGATGSMKRS
jgi:hypothetical protein